MPESLLEVLWTARYQYEKGSILDNHKHTYHQIICFLSGSGEATLDNVRHRYSSNNLLYCRPGVIHGIFPNQEVKTKTLDIKFRVYDEGLNARLKDVRGFITDISPEIIEILESIRQEGIERKSYFKEIGCTRLLQLLYLLLRISEKNDSIKHDDKVVVLHDEQNSAAASIQNYINVHFPEDISIVSISKDLGYSRGYISQIFKKAYQCTVMDYVQLCRIEKAKELIAYSEYSLKQIFEAVGFKSIHHFTRVFKNLEGMSPGKWSLKECKGIRKDIYFDDSFNNSM